MIDTWVTDNDIATVLSFSTPLKLFNVKNLFYLELVIVSPSSNIKIWRFLWNNFVEIGIHYKEGSEEEHAAHFQAMIKQFAISLISFL